MQPLVDVHDELLNESELRTYTVNPAGETYPAEPASCAVESGLDAELFEDAEPIPYPPPPHPLSAVAMKIMKAARVVRMCTSLRGLRERTLNDFHAHLQTLFSYVSG